MGLPILTRGIPRGVCRRLVGIVARLGKGIGWDSSVVWSKSEPIYPTLDNVVGECAELKCVLKLVKDPERACPSET
mgnify:CR=1 FL=1